MEGRTGSFNIEEILQRLSAPVTEPSAAVTNMTPQGQETSGAATKKRGSNRTPRRIYTEEELAKRHRESQKVYRERRRQGNIEVQKQITETATAIEAARLEQVSLLVEHTAMMKIKEYCTAAIEAAQTLVSNSFNTAQSQFTSVMDGWAWLGFQIYSPSDAQLYAFLDTLDSKEIDSLSEKAMQRSVKLAYRWEAEPEARESIEEQLEMVRGMRLRTMMHLAKTRPSVVVDLVRGRIIPTGPDGEPNPKLVEAVAAMNLTPEQLESFERQWILYFQRTESMRQEARSLISFLASGSNGDDVTSFSVGAAGLFMDRLQALQELELHPSNETRALLSLTSWIPSNLTMQQKVCLMRHTMPNFPDIIQIGRILFGDKHARTVRPDRVQNVDMELN